MAKQTHRGRLQAQGGGLEKSESWAQEEPLTAKKGLWLLRKLRRKLPKKEAKLREEQFGRAEDLIRRIGEAGGKDAHFSKSFGKKGNAGIRVDIEILSGRAFVCLALLLILWFLFK